jgi:hypothetical protein
MMTVVVCSIHLSKLKLQHEHISFQTHLAFNWFRLTLGIVIHLFCIFCLIRTHIWVQWKIHWIQIMWIWFGMKLSFSKHWNILWLLNFSVIFS